MIRSLLKEAYELLSHLNTTGYFGGTFPVKEISAHPRSGGVRGEAIYCPVKGKKLTREEAIDIYKEDRYPLPELAELYGVTISTVYDIKDGRTWRKATGATLKLRRNRPIANTNSKALTAKDALDIYREKTMSSAELAEIYNVTTTTIANIKAGRTWAATTGHKK